MRFDFQARFPGLAAQGGKKFPGGVHWLCRFLVALCESDPVQGIESDTLFQRVRSGQEDVLNILKGVIIS